MDAFRGSDDGPGERHRSARHALQSGRTSIVWVRCPLSGRGGLSRSVHSLNAEDQLPGVEDAPEETEYGDATDDVQGACLTRRDTDGGGDGHREEREAR